MGEPLLIKEETVKRDNLYRGRVLALLPYSHKCPDNIKVQTGLDWEESESESKKFKQKVPCGGADELFGDERAFNNPLHQNNHRVDKLSNHNSKGLDGERGLVESKELRLGKGCISEGVLKSNNCKGKRVAPRNPNQQGRRPTEYKEALLIENEGGGCRSSSSEESERGLIVISPKHKGESSKVGLGQEMGGNIVVDLGCVLIDEGGNQVSHVLTTQYSNFTGEVSSKACYLESGKRRSMVNSRKNSSSLKHHGMVTHNDRSNGLHVPGSVSRSEICLSQGKGRWNLEEEVVKVIEKGVALGVIVDQEENKGCGKTMSDERKKKCVRWSLSEEVAKIARLPSAYQPRWSTTDGPIKEGLQLHTTPLTCPVAHQS
ncbi:hypothetical protein LWI29_025578 [Acer saccharum]|uniref:Uncharacterized protein n=1 Tax=Acer saccharum TaxID=4024 RepID=A0AA39W580_ACESA|nr:hypothetical protein LWI29_025578 [Acer saccharum]